LKAHIANNVIFELEINGHAVAAERIVTFRNPVGASELEEIARAAAVIQDHLLIELLQFVKHGDSRLSTSRTSQTGGCPILRAMARWRCGLRSHWQMRAEASYG